MGIFQGAFFIVGTGIGAGFISGAELARFFPSVGFVLPVMLSSVLFFLECLLFLRLGKRYGGYFGTLNSLFGRGATVVSVVICLCALVPCAGMLAGLNSLLPSLSPLPALVGLAVVLLCIRKGMAGISALNSVLVPALLVFIFACSGGGRAEFATENLLPYGNGLLYACMNAFLAAPVLMDAGREMKRTVPPAAMASAVIGAGALCILSAVYGAGDGALNAEMPFLFVMRGSKLFFVAAALAILTSLASAIYPMLCLCGRLNGKKKNAAKIGVLFAALLLSSLGIGGIVRVLYPVLGFGGMILSAFCIFYEHLFKKHHQKVHTGGKHAEDKGRAHHKVKFKHLPAVNNQISEPRARNDVLAHDRADPCHADVHFQHGNKGRARRGNYKLL